MAKTESKISQYTSIIDKYFNWVAIGTLLIVTCLIVSKYIDIQNINNDLVRYDNKLVELNMEKQVYEEEISKIDNIDNLINDIKNDYYKNALEIETKVRNDELDLKIAFLTFDDGPYLLTDKYLDVLAKYDVQATFFTRERRDVDYDSIYQRYIIECHTIGNHTSSHKIRKGIYRSEENFVEDILKNREFIYNKLGYTTNIMRFPGGSYQVTYMGLNKKSLVNKLVSLNYGYVDWNLATGDGGKTLSASQYASNVLNYSNNLKVGVVLMHDYSKNTLEALPTIIEGMSKQGYIFLPLYYDSPTVIKN